MADTSVSLLPPNATTLETAMEGSVARITDVPTPCRDVWNADNCPSDLLPWLAWAFSVDFWDSTWTDDQKRASIKAAVAVQRIKGTIGSVTQALGALGYGVTIQEWFRMLPAGAPYTFDVLMDTTQVGIDEAAITKIISYIDVTKNLRSHLLAIIPSVTTQAGPTFAGALCMGSEITIAYSAAPHIGHLDVDFILDKSELA